MELQVGRAYRAKKPAQAGSFLNSYYNDRQILWMSGDGSIVQYDGPAVGHGRKYPKVTREAFEKWASHDVTDQLPESSWQRWDK